MSVTLIPSISVGEVTLTSGTGSYAITGNAITRCFPFADFLTDGDTAYFEISDGVQLEWVSGTYTSTTITRDSVLNSTNADMAIDWPASGQRFIRLASASETDSGATPLGFVLGGTAGQIGQYAATGNAISGATVSGDAAIAVGGALTIGTAAVTVPKGGTGLSSGTSGAVPYYSSTTTIASSALLSTNALVLGGGAGVAPFSATKWSATTSNLTGNFNAGAVPGAVGTGFYAAGIDGTATGATFDTFASIASFYLRRANTTAVAPSRLSADDEIGRIEWRGWATTTTYTTGRARISGFAAENWTNTTIQGAYVDVFTTPTGSATIARSARFQASGGLSVGNTTDNGIGSITANAGFYGPLKTTLTSAHIYVGNGSNIATDVALSGDATIDNTGLLTIASHAVTNAKAAQMAAHTFKGNNTGSTADALDLTATQLTAELLVMVGDTGAGGSKGLVPAPASGDAAAQRYLKADGTWATPSGSGLSSTLTSAHLLVGNGSNVATDVAITGDVTISNTGVTTIGSAAVTVAKGGTGIGSGTSGGIPYYSSTSTIASSALLANTAVMLGGGAGAAPSTIANWTATTTNLVGNFNSSAGPGAVGSGDYLVGADTVSTGTTIDTFAAGATFYMRRANTTNASRSRLSTDDEIGRFEWRGWATTTTYTTGRARIAGFAAENWTNTTIQGAYIDIFTTPTGSATIARSTRFQASGGISVGNTTDNGIGTITANAGFYGPLNTTLTSAHLYVGSASNIAVDVAITGDVTISNAGVTAIGANKVTNSMSAQMAAHTFRGNNTGSTGNVLDLTATQLTAELNGMVGDSGSGGTKGLVPAPASGDAAAQRYLKADGTWATPSGSGLSATLTSAHLYVGNGSNVATDVAVSGDLTLANTGAFTIAGHAVTNAKAAQMAGHTFKGNNTGSTADSIDLTIAQMTAELLGNSFVAFSGPASTVKTFTLPNANATVLTDNALVTVAQGGTGLGSGTSGGIPYYSGSTTIASSAALTSKALVLGGGAGAAPTSSAFWTEDSNGNLLVDQNTGTPPGILASLSGIYVCATDGNSATIQLDAFGAGGGLIMRSAGGTAASLAATPTTTVIGSMGGRGYTGSAFSVNRALMRFVTTELWTSGHNGTLIEFQTTITGGTSTGLRAQIASGLSVGTTTDNGTGTVTANNSFFVGAVNVTPGQLAASQASPADPTGTSNTTGLMMGLAGSITPTFSGRVQITVCGTILNSASGDGAKVQIRHGTGSAPANAAALTGTAVGSLQRYTAAASNGAGVPFSLTAIVTGLTIAAHWIDVGLAAITGGTASITDVSISAMEF